MNQPEDILKEWLEAVNKADMEKLLTLYDRSAVLIPTFSNRILNTPEKIRKYFETLESRDKLSVELHSSTVYKQKINDDIYSLSGIYCWRFSVDNEILSFEARFSYLINVTAKNPIFHHHSSQIPRTL